VKTWKLSEVKMENGREHGTSFFKYCSYNIVEVESIRLQWGNKGIKNDPC
jgi:hypothetical protein